MLNPTELFLTLSPSAVLYPLPIRHERSSASWLPKSLQSVVRGSSRRQGSPVWGSSGRHVVRKDQEACHMTQLTRILRSHGPSKIRTRIIRTTFSWLAFPFILRDNIWTYLKPLQSSVDICVYFVQANSALSYCNLFPRGQDWENYCIAFSMHWVPVLWAQMSSSVAVWLAASQLGGMHLI